MKLIGLLATILSLALLSACSVSNTIPPVSTDTDATLPSDKSELLAQYDRLVAELADLRAETYNTHRDIIARINALEAALVSLGVTVPPPAPTESGATSESESLLDSLPTETVSSTIPSENAFAPFSYTLENGQATLIAYRPNPSDLSNRDVTVPSTLGGCPVTRIGDSAFEGTFVCSVTLPATVTHIGWFAFRNCPALSTVTIPATVEHIDYGAFDASPALTLRVSEGSYAAHYAAAFGLRYRTN